MRFVLCTTPIRPVPTTYPPFGSLALIQALRAAGFAPTFYDIDGLRPSFEAVEKFFADIQPDVLGISAVVSTAYDYTKQLVRMVRRVSPKTRIVVGGNLAASAEILHRLAGVDVCVAAEGEVILVNLLRAWEASGTSMAEDVLDQVRGITFLRKNGDMAFTGYELKLPPEEVFKPDYSILEEFSDIKNYIRDPLERVDFQADPRSFEPHRKGKTLATLVGSKGCVARCTFCHRWDKGYRAVPVAQTMEYIRRLMDRYNVGFLLFSDENFGSDRRQTEEFLRHIKPLDLLWQAGGVRVRSMDLDLLQRMKDAGCVAVYYGMETGSPTILKVMEKNATLENNLNAVRWTREAGLTTIYQMVLAMPGETERTIRETMEFLKRATEGLFESPRSRMSINYIQALPGTPVYEYARHQGLIGKSLLDEEQYLLSISDVDAQDDAKMLNFTDSDTLTVRSWRRRIVLEVMRHYHLHNKTPTPSFSAFVWRMAKRRLFRRKGPAATSDEIKSKVIEDYAKGGYFNLSRDLGYDVIVAYFYPLRNLILAAWLIQDEWRRVGPRVTLVHVWEWLAARLKPRPTAAAEAVSLRKTMQALNPPPATPTEAAMQPLRDGR